MGARAFIAHLAHHHGLRADLDRDEAADLAWVHSDPALHHRLVIQRGWSIDRFEQWLVRDHHLSRAGRRRYPRRVAAVTATARSGCGTQVLRWQLAGRRCRPGVRPLKRRVSFVAVPVAWLRMRAQVLKGHLDGLLLATLEAGPRHGYAIAEALRSGSGGRVDLPKGTVYPALYRLERAGVGERRVVDGGWTSATQLRADLGGACGAG